MWFGMWGQEGLSRPSVRLSPEERRHHLEAAIRLPPHTLLTFYELTAAAGRRHSFILWGSEQAASDMLQLL